MKTVLTTTDRSLVESLRIALDSEGIAAVDNSGASGALPFVPITVAVADDRDWERALAIARQLQRTPSGAWHGVPVSPRLLRALLLVLLLILAIVCIDRLGP